MKIIKRIQSSLIKEHLKKSPIVAILGARQVGKTTLVEKLLGEDRAFYSFDDPALISIAQSNPRSFLTQANKITLDEVQKCPAILSSLKRIVDEEKVPGRFLITGSANITMLPKISETLAGRITFVDIFPLTIFEICSFNENPIAIDILSCNNYNDC
jgi:predicted AAA+ superfamily ATPase